MDDRKRQITNRCCMTLISFLLLLSQSQDLYADGCSFRVIPQFTLTEKLSKSKVVVVAEWTSAKKGRSKNFDQTTFQIKEIIQQSDEGTLKVGEQVTINGYHLLKQKVLFLLLKSKAASTNWDKPLKITDASLSYITQAPPFNATATQRLRYFLTFLEDSDELIAKDAFDEFTKAPFDEVAAIAPELPREKLRNWIESPETPLTRLRLYGLLLGLCAQKSDIKFMELKINEPTKYFRLGIDGLMSGYLLQTGSVGLDKIDQTKFIPKDVPVSETLAAMSSLRFMWYHGNGKISQSRLRKSMQLLLDRPELADLVVIDLARWNDWSILDTLMVMYAAEDYNIPSIKRAIIRYTLLASKGKSKNGDGADAVTAKKAKQFLDHLRKEDPKTVKSAERFFFFK